MLDVDRIREDFPAFIRRPDGESLIYLDSAATTQKPRVVLEAMSGYYTEFCANVHRGSHEPALRATDAFEAARERIARFVGAPATEGVIFTKNCTEAVNLVAYAWARGHLGPGDELLVSGAEHHSNLVPWQLAAAERGATLRHIPLTPDGELDTSGLDRLLGARTKLVAVTGMSNVLGTVVELAPIVEAAHAVGARVLVDGAQLVAHAPVDFGALGADWLVFSGHKLLGPTGIGVLVGRPEVLEQMPPFLAGGEMVRSVTLHDAEWSPLPRRFEAGSPPIAEAIGLGAAVDYLTALGPGAVARHDALLCEAGRALLEPVEGLVRYGSWRVASRAPIFTFNLQGAEGALIHPHELEPLLAEDGIAIRVGHHCAEPLLRALGAGVTCRASCACYSRPDELAALADALTRARRFLLRR
jgi:cysteine desulfurase/selenocysteine lyase